VIFLTDFFYAASRRHNDVILLPVIRRVCGNNFVFQQDSALAHCAAHVQQLNCCVKTPNFLASNLWPPNSPDLSPVDYEIWAVMQHHVYHRQIHSVDELKRRLIDVWCGLEQSIFDETIDQRRGLLTTESVYHASNVGQYILVHFTRHFTFYTSRFDVRW